MNKTQKLRFKGFSGEWESKKLGEITLKTGIKNKDNEMYDVYSISNKYGFIPQDEQFENSRLSGLDKSLYQIVGKGEFAYNPARINVGSIGVLEEDKKVIVSSLYVCFRLKEGFDYRLFKTYFDSYKFNKDVIRNTEGSVREYLFYENFSRIKMNIPKLEEQQKIASFFSLIDKKISLQSEKVEMVKEYKKGMMQKIFSRELRFKDNSGRDYPEWEVTTVENIADLEKGFTPDTKNEKNWTGNVPWLSIADMKQGKYISKVSKYISEEALGTKKLIPKGTLIMSFKLTLGRVAIVNREIMTNEAICHFYWKNKDIDTEYMYYYLSSINIESFGCRAAKGITLNNESLNSIVVKLPTIEEQKKIASVLMKLDEKIQKEQYKLDSLNEYKKGLLQQMFV